MSDINGKLAYLRGLADGVNLSESETDESKILLAMIDMLTDVAIELQAVDFRLKGLAEDVVDLEDEMYTDHITLEDVDFDDDTGLFEVTCNHCEAKTLVSEEAMVSEEPVICPSCNKEIEIEVPRCCADECECNSPETDPENPPDEK